MIKAARRLRSSDVERVLKAGSTLHTETKGGVRAKVLPREKPSSLSRFAVVVSKKTAGSAVVRNRQRRMAFATLGTLPSFKNSYDIVLMLGKRYETQAALKGEIQVLLTRLVG